MGIKVREKKLKSGKKSLYLDIYHNGKRSYEFLGLYLDGDRQTNKETRQLAQSIRAKRQLELQNRSHGFTPKFKLKANFIAYFQKFADEFTDKQNRTYQNVLNYVEEFAGSELQFGSIDKWWVRDFKDFLGGKVAQSTARNYLTVLKAVLNRAVKDEIIETNPADKVDNFKSTDPKIVYLTLEELRKLAKTDFENDQLKKAFLFGCYSGLRFSDLKRLQWDNINNGQIEFRQKKTSSPEYVPLNRQARKILDGLPNRGDRVFTLPGNDWSNHLLREWAKKAKIKKRLHFHVSRHTFAVQLLAHGADIYTLKELLGHKSLASTEVYAKVVNKTKKEAVNNLPEIDL